jgi:hypothetical protein
MKDLSIEKLDERNTGNYHIIRKMNEVVEAINTLIEMAQELEESGFVAREPQDALPDSED